MSKPEDYKCRECNNFVLYRSDHKETCKHYANPHIPWASQN